MPEPISRDRISGRLRLLEVHAVVSSLVLAALLVLAFMPAGTADVLRARRVEILQEDGKYALVLAGAGNLPGPTFDGREYPQETSGGRVQATGMIFFNALGDEVGGLTYRAQVRGDSYSASGGVTFDQFHQDQVVSLQYSDNGSSRRAGVVVWDRSTELKIGDLVEAMAQRSILTGSALDSLEAVIEEMSAKAAGPDRVFLGSADRAATLLLRDRIGRPRIRMYVDSLDVARLEFLDSAGTVVSAFPR